MCVCMCVHASPGRPGGPGGPGGPGSAETPPEENCPKAEENLNTLFPGQLIQWKPVEKPAINKLTNTHKMTEKLNLLSFDMCCPAPCCVQSKNFDGEESLTDTPTHHQGELQQPRCSDLLSALLELMLSDVVSVIPGSPRSPLAPVNKTYESLMAPYLERCWDQKPKHLPAVPGRPAGPMGPAERSRRTLNLQFNDE